MTTTLRTLIALAALWATIAQAAPPPAEPPLHVSARSRILLRLDPHAAADPKGSAAIGSFRVLASGPAEAEAAGWIGHVPYLPSWGADVAGDVSVLRLRFELGDAWFSAGRQWSSIAGQRLTGVDGLTAGYALTRHASVAGRVGFALGPAGEALGDTLEYGAEARFDLPAAHFSLGVLNTRAEDVPVHTRWTLTGAYTPSAWLSAHGAITADVQTRGLVDARIEVGARPWQPLWVRAYSRYAEIEQLLPPGDLLAVFAPDPRGEAGALAEWHFTPTWAVRLDGALVGVRPDEIGGRARAALEGRPGEAGWCILEATARTEAHGRSGLVRVAGRAPQRAQRRVGVAVDADQQRAAVERAFSVDRPPRVAARTAGRESGQHAPHEPPWHPRAPPS
ncbi:MAG: hypothetical protein KC620_12680 [Myxococcales bacterium]|nr:hypothetical protein [Myxococcales bacterium]